MKHLKRQAVPKNWPIPRKGNKFVVKNISKGIPLLIVLRDMLKLAQNRREVKKAVAKQQIVISNKIARDERKSLELFDILRILPMKKNYRITLSEKGKYALEEINEKDSNLKISKIIGKKILKGKKIQINLSDGRNYLSDLDCNVNDSAIIDLEKNKIKKILVMKEKAKILVVGGKHAGEKGKITKMDTKLKSAEIESKDKKSHVLIKQIMVIG
jgi:small subunit ribosomal protein S4e